MNYRHIYHAGNFADIFKHLILTMLLDHLRAKEKGVLLLDAFAGTGLYDLNTEQAQRTREYEGGLAAFMSVAFAQSDLNAFQSLLRPFSQMRTYPGSPLLMAKSLRLQDRLIANELHPEDWQVLKGELRAFSSVRVTRMDAYECIRAHVPPPERRGLVLIDPPFERKDEFETLAAQSREWHKRWPTGCYAIWYPVKADTSLPVLLDSVHELSWRRAWLGEFMLHPRERREGLNGCGMLLLNAPYQVPERIEALAPALKAALKAQGFASQWITPPD